VRDHSGRVKSQGGVATEKVIEYRERYCAKIAGEGSNHARIVSDYFSEVSMIAIRSMIRVSNRPNSRAENIPA
jgi:hypothetical protein